MEVHICLSLQTFGRAGACQRAPKISKSHQPAPTETDFKPGFPFTSPRLLPQFPHL